MTTKEQATAMATATATATATADPLRDDNKRTGNDNGATVMALRQYLHSTLATIIDKRKMN